MGGDPLAVDATCCRLMRLCPEKIEQFGETIAALAQPFATVAHRQELCVGQPA